MTLFAVKVCIGAAVFFLALVFSQDIQIFPGVLNSILGKASRNSPPAGTQEYFVETEDKKRIHVWHLAAPGRPRASAILFHGNAETVASAYGYQLWLRSLGISSYSFDYRGYGQSSGWPSEAGIYRDADAVWKLAAQQQDFSSTPLVIMSNSIGTGPAAYLASKANPAVLILLAPYTSLTDLVRAKPIYRLFAPFLWYELPTAAYLKKLTDTCVIIAHGKRDTIIPWENSSRLEELLKNLKIKNRVIYGERAGHNDIFEKEQSELSAAVSAIFTNSCGNP